jgi:hypothetical protein
MKQPITFIREIDTIIYEFAKNPVVAHIEKTFKEYNRAKRHNMFFEYFLNKNYMKNKSFYKKNNIQRLHNSFRLFECYNLNQWTRTRRNLYNRYTYNYKTADIFRQFLDLPKSTTEMYEFRNGFTVDLKDLESESVYTFTKTFFYNNFIAGFRNNDLTDIIFRSKGRSSPNFGQIVRRGFEPDIEYMNFRYASKIEYIFSSI